MTRSGSFVRSESAMGTAVTIEVAAAAVPRTEVARRVKRAFGWFRVVDTHCSRFEPESDVMRLARRPGEAVPADVMLFEAARFAMALAEETEGAFDPTVGFAMERRGDDVSARTGRHVKSQVDVAPDVTFRDVHVDEAARTIMLRRPLVLDLGAVAKGLAVDLAARELKDLPGFVIDAGGDIYARGVKADGTPWRVGVRHPCDHDSLLETIAVRDAAVCTSGNYEKPDGHILDPRAGEVARSCESVTVVAPVTMVADALATAAFVLGPSRGLALLERHGVHGLIVDAELGVHTTRGWSTAPSEVPA